MNIRETLFEHSDEKYKRFSSALIPNVAPERVIGVRTPFLKTLAKELYKEGWAESFLKELPHKYQEENNLHAFIINLQKDFETCIGLLDEFLPFVDNWATCDGLRPVCFSKNKLKLLSHIDGWLTFVSPLHPALRY